MPNGNCDEIIEAIVEKLNISKKTAETIVEKARIGGEISESVNVETWLHKRFLQNCVFIDESGYAQMCIDALKIVSKVAPTDFGSSRQRDFGQSWADMTRGYLGELAFKIFLKKHGIGAELRHEEGEIEEFLPQDIHGIKRVGESEFSLPKLKVGIKTIKWNGIWFDIPGVQFNKSHLHVLVKVGTERGHLFAFLKALSVFKDKILRRGIDEGFISEIESNTLFDRLPSFKPIPAYICGFVSSETFRKSQNNNGDLPYSGKKGTKNYTITSWNGPIESGDLDRIKKKEGLEKIAKKVESKTKNGKDSSKKETGKVKFEGIGEFSHQSGFLFNTGNLFWKEKDWKREVIDKL